MGESLSYQTWIPLKRLEIAPNFQPSCTGHQPEIPQGSYFQPDQRKVGKPKAMDQPFHRLSSIFLISPKIHMPGGQIG